MNEFPFAGIGFDLDGTLLDTHRDLGAAVNYALELGGFETVPVGSSKDLIGGGAKIMLARAVEQQGGMPRDDFRTLYKKMLAFYGENAAVHSRPYPNVIETLDALADRGVSIAVVTNKFESFARSVLGQLGLTERFAAVIGGDTLGKGRAKPAPDPVIEARRLCGASESSGARFAFVGDSSYDVASARAAGVPVVVAGYGYCDRPPHELEGDAVIDDMRDLLPMLEAL